MATDNQPKPTTQFLAFVEQSREILGGQKDRIAPEKAFEQFVAAGMPLVLPRLKSSLPLLIREAKLLRRWLTPYDILSVAGLAGAENPYIELVAWLLDPQTHAPSAARRQKAWLRIVGIEDRIDFTVPVTPRTQFRTDNGIPDLVLVYPNGVVIVEVKTFTVEHLVPSGESQCAAYARAVLERLALPNAKAHMVFMTPDAAPPQNQDAIPTTFTALVVALAKELGPEDVPADLRWALSSVFTHLLNRTFLAYDDVHSLLDDIIQCADELSHPKTDAVLISRLKRIQHAEQLLKPEARS